MQTFMKKSIFLHAFSTNLKLQKRRSDRFRQTAQIDGRIDEKKVNARVPGWPKCLTKQPHLPEKAAEKIPEERAYKLTRALETWVGTANIARQSLITKYVTSLFAGGFMQDLRRVTSSLWLSSAKVHLERYVVNAVIDRIDSENKVKCLTARCVL